VSAPTRRPGEVRILAATPRGGTILVTVEGDEPPTGGPHDPALYQPVRLYHTDRGQLTEPLWLGSALKFLGGYLEEPALDEAAEELVRSRVAAALRVLKSDKQDL
jgi:hypothetical protein